MQQAKLLVAQTIKGWTKPQKTVQAQKNKLDQHVKSALPRRWEKGAIISAIFDNDPGVDLCCARFMLKIFDKQHKALTKYVGDLGKVKTAEFFFLMHAVWQKRHSTEPTAEHDEEHVAMLLDRLRTKEHMARKHARHLLTVGLGLPYVQCIDCGYCAGTGAEAKDAFDPTRAS